MRQSSRVVCFKSAEEIAEYISESQRSINQLIIEEDLPAWKRGGFGPWRALNIDLDVWLVKQRDKYMKNRKHDAAND